MWKQMRRLSRLRMEERGDSEEKIEERTKMTKKLLQMPRINTGIALYKIRDILI